MNQYRILIDAKDKKGLVYQASNIFFKNDLNILSNNEFVDREKGQFFMRSVVTGEGDAASLQQELLKSLPDGSKVDVKVIRKKNIVLLATKEAHVLGDILIRYEEGELDANILGVVSNYNSLRTLVERFNIPYYHVSHENLSREAHEEKLLSTLERFSNIDYIVLAKYMRILTPGFVEQYNNKILNIHHSFLPAFIGANPYKQAYERGVKIIGATAHFVNNDLDEGPIVAQDTIHVDHAYSAEDLRAVGRDVEKSVLARALKLALEDRIFVSGNKTVIF